MPFSVINSKTQNKYLNDDLRKEKKNWKESGLNKQQNQIRVNKLN